MQIQGRYLADVMTLTHLRFSAFICGSKMFLRQLLIKTLKRLTTEIVVVVNDDDALTESAERFQSVPLIRRANTGMNIGGWGATYRFYPNYDFYIFMQDECEVIREDFVNAYQSELSKDNVGMTGEVINQKWNIEWTKLALSPLNYIAGVDALGMPIPRVTYYLQCLRDWEIDPGVHATHLRALVWGFNSRALEVIKNFPVGLNKEQCIAAEIAVSKKIEQHGYKVTQVSDFPFRYIHHVEWRKGGLNKKRQALC